MQRTSFKGRNTILKNTAFILCNYFLAVFKTFDVISRIYRILSQNPLNKIKKFKSEYKS